MSSTQAGRRICVTFLLSVSESFKRLSKLALCNCNLKLIVLIIRCVVLECQRHENYYDNNSKPKFAALKGFVAFKACKSFRNEKNGNS